MENLTNKKLELLDMLLDDRVEMYGVINTIQYLLDNDFTKEELLEMKFDEADINEAIEDDAGIKEAIEEYMEAIEEDMEDLDPINVRYEVWAVGYDAEDFCTDVELLLGTYDNKEEAIEKAESFNSLNDVKKYMPDNLKLDDGDYVNILVETIKNDDPTNTNIDTAFLKVLI